MSKTAMEILISCLILSLVLISITLYRGEVEIVQSVIEYSEDIEKIDDSNMLFTERNTVYGSDVISFIRYYANDSSVEVKVNIGGSLKSYVNETYDKNIFEVPYEEKFTNQVTYDGKNIKKIECTKN